MTNTSDTLTITDRQVETARICNSLTLKISKEERDRLYGSIACLSRSAFNIGQFPDAPELTDPRFSFGAKVLIFAERILDKERSEFKLPFLEITSFESDMALDSLYNSMGMLEESTREETSKAIFALVEASYQAGATEEPETEAPMTILGGISTW